MTSIDITKFAELACKAQYQEDDPAVLEELKSGLSFRPLDNYMNLDQPRTKAVGQFYVRRRLACYHPTFALGQGISTKVQLCDRYNCPD
jgi:hypothetical protein